MFFSDLVLPKTWWICAGFFNIIIGNKQRPTALKTVLFRQSHSGVPFFYTSNIKENDEGNIPEKLLFCSIIMYFFWQCLGK